MQGGPTVAQLVVGSRAKVAVIPFEGGAPVALLDLPGTSPGRNPLAWTADGHAIACIDASGGASNVRALPLDGSSPRLLTDFKSDDIFWFALSGDGRRLACARGRSTTDVVLINDFR